MENEINKRKTTLHVVLYMLSLLFCLSFFSPSFPAWELGLLRNKFFQMLLLISILLLVVYRFSLNENAGNQVKQFFLSRELRVLVVILLLVFAGRAFIFLFSNGDMNADSDTMLNMGRKIVEDGARPVYYFSQYYNGALITYFYAAAYFIFNSIASMYAVNLLFFSLGLFFAYRLYSFDQKNGNLFILLGVTLSKGFVVISLDTWRGFPLAFFLMMLIIFLIYKSMAEGRNHHFLIGLSMGMLYYQYQPSLMIILALGVIVFIDALKSSKFISFLMILPGVVAGLFPHLLSELYNDFVNTRFMIIDNLVSGKGIEPGWSSNAWQILQALAEKAFAPGWPAIAGLLVGTAGLLAYLAGFYKKRKLAPLLIPFVFLSVIFFLIHSGGDPAHPHFGAHFTLYSVFFVFFTAKAFANGLFNGKRIFIFFMTVFLLIANLVLFQGYFHEFKIVEEKNKPVLNYLNNMGIDFITGQQYRHISKYNSRFRNGKGVFAIQHLYQPIPWSTIGQYQPDLMALATGWNQGKKIYFSFSENIDPWLKHLDLKFSRQTLGPGFSYRIRSNVPPAIYHFLSRMEGNQALLNAYLENWKKPWQDVESIELENERIVVRLLPRESLDYHGYSIRLNCREKEFSLEFPLTVCEGQVVYEFPGEIEIPSGEYLVEYLWQGWPVYRDKTELKPMNHSPSVFISSLTSLNKVFFSLRDETLLQQEVIGSAGYEIEKMPRENWERLFHAPANIISASVPILQDALIIDVLDPKIEMLKLEIISMIDTDSSEISKLIKQHLVLDRGDDCQLIELKPGYNLITIELSGLSRLSLTSSVKNFFIVEDVQDNQNLGIASIAVLTVEGLDREGRRKFFLKPFLRPGKTDS